MTTPRKLLSASILAGAALAATPAAAHEAAPEQPPASVFRCRVGNGKGPMYVDGLYACLRARGQGADVRFVVRLPDPPREEPRAARPAREDRK